MKPGDKVRIKTDKKLLEGILMPTTNKKYVVIKLRNGYNIGIEKVKIKSIKKIASGKRLAVFPSIKLKQKPGLPSVSLIATGGTISSRIDYETGGVKWLMHPGQIFALAPELADIIRIRKIERPFMLGSENMAPKHWQQIALIAAKLLNSGDAGLLITHGTDTLHYTAAALSFMLRNLSKPVVLTYAQRSTDRASTDTALNLICAAHAAKSNIAEVMLVGHATTEDTFCYALRGTKVRKMHTSRRDTFRPINDLPLAKIWANGKIEIISKCKKREQNKVKADTAFEEKIALIKFYPGAAPALLDWHIDAGYKGLIIEMTGLGHVATAEARKNWIPSIRKAIKAGLIVCAVPQTLYGALDPLVYATGRQLLKEGVLYLRDILPETAYVKLGWVLAHSDDTEHVKELMLKNIAGEFNERLSPATFMF